MIMLIPKLVCPTCPPLCQTIDSAPLQREIIIDESIEL